MTNLKTIGRVRARVRKAAKQPARIKRALAILSSAKEHVETTGRIFDDEGFCLDLDDVSDAAWDTLDAAVRRTEEAGE